jgi:cytidylate kinase
VAANAPARQALLPVQRSHARGGGIVVAGRDIGSVVLPEADVRLYLDVPVEERAARRARQRGVDPASSDGRAILADLRQRDELDRSRATAPLRVPPGATVVDGSGSFEATVAAVVGAVRAAERGAQGSW